MIYQTFPMELAGSNPGSKLTVYIQEKSPEIMIEKRPMVVICPGGGYAFTSDREAEVFALEFLSMGYQAAVLRYSVDTAKFPTALTELAYSVKLVRDHAEEWFVDPDAILVTGSSAGGHLAASLGTLWQEKFLADAMGMPVEENTAYKPDGMILCYPVISSGEYAHRDSFLFLLGQEEGTLAKRNDPESLVAKLSLENRVTENTPPVFIWHTFTDGTVPVENSLLFVSALRKAGVSTEFHLFPEGGHGLCLANRLTRHVCGDGIQPECAVWTELVHTWIEKNYVK